MSDKRVTHIYQVACLMRKLAPQLRLDPEEMFTLGWLHDVGYAFGDHDTHAQIGGALLEKMRYPYSREVLYHGDTTGAYQSLALDLLNFCDMHIDSQGKFVTFDARLADIKKRYGAASQTYGDCCRLVAILRDKKHLQLLELENK